MSLPDLHLLRLSGCTIFRQLQIEEALLRADDRNWCIVQDGAPSAIVMGISGTVDTHIDRRKLLASPVPVVKRFSGGGTVFVDRNTLFVSFILSKDMLLESPTPDRIFTWSESLYSKVFDDHPFRLHERDYIFDERKFGGNAQYIRKERWLHHTTFLWDYDRQCMDYLLLPEKRPNYRNDRAHGDFLCALKDYLPDRNDFWRRLELALSSRFTVKPVLESAVEPILQLPHRTATNIVQDL